MIGRKTRALLLAGPSAGMAAGVAATFTGLMTGVETLALTLAAAAVAGVATPAGIITLHAVRRTIRVIGAGRVKEDNEVLRLGISGYLISFAVAIPGGIGAAITGGVEERPPIGMGGAFLVSALCLTAAWGNLRLMRGKTRQGESDG